MIEPRKRDCGRADGVSKPEGNTTGPNGLGLWSPRGLRAGHASDGSSRNLGGLLDPLVSDRVWRSGDPGLADVGERAEGVTSEQTTFGTWDLLCEGNRARRDEQEGVGSPHSTVDIGEPALGDSVEERG